MKGEAPSLPILSLILATIFFPEGKKTCKETMDDSTLIPRCVRSSRKERNLYYRPNGELDGGGDSSTRRQWQFPGLCRFGLPFGNGSELTFPIHWSKPSKALELPKPSNLRLGNWDTPVLSKEHLSYVATDAFVSWHLYQVLKSLPDAPMPKHMDRE
ncbi:unnamed protein product [Cuscuta campestris]|uniref:Uncharacterized protein n=1 Tax=Cuscuta campestris TaxID=132261 RepID=A0A484KUH8_9ASTE|nr:unnamed protein product [Cuscuta campestris]